MAEETKVRQSESCPRYEAREWEAALVTQGSQLRPGPIMFPNCTATGCCRERETDSGVATIVAPGLLGPSPSMVCATCSLASKRKPGRGGIR